MTLDEKINVSMIEQEINTQAQIVKAVLEKITNLRKIWMDGQGKIILTAEKGHVLEELQDLEDKVLVVAAPYLQERKVVIKEFLDLMTGLERREKETLYRHYVLDRRVMKGTRDHLMKKIYKNRKEEEL